MYVSAMLSIFLPNGDKFGDSKLFNCDRLIRRETYLTSDISFLCRDYPSELRTHISLYVEEGVLGFSRVGDQMKEKTIYMCVYIHTQKIDR